MEEQGGGIDANEKVLARHLLAPDSVVNLIETLVTFDIWSFVCVFSSSPRHPLYYLLSIAQQVLEKHVGKGAFGDVFQGKCLGEPCAVKTMIDVTEATVRSFRAEILLTGTLRHPNIVSFIGACWGAELTCLVIEWVPGGSVEGLLGNPLLDLTWDEPLLRLATDIARGMEYLHAREYFDEADGQSKRCIIHRDLKPDNSLLSSFLRAKLCDFGTSRAKATADDVTMTAVGTPLFVAPEIVHGEAYDEKVITLRAFHLNAMRQRTLI